MIGSLLAFEIAGLEMMGGGGVVLLGQSGPMLPSVVVVPTSMVLMLLLAGHVLSVVRSDAPDSRKRIRGCNGVIMMLCVATITAGVSVLDPERHVAGWVMCWTAAFALVWFSILLALLDALNTYRLTMLRRLDARARLDEALAESRARLGGDEDALAVDSFRGSGSGGGGGRGTRGGGGHD